MSSRAAAVPFVLVVACASSSTSPAQPSCDDLQSAARSEVASAIAASTSCKVDGDCVSVGFAVGGCFDSCTRAVAASGTSAVDAAKAKVDGAQCKDFRDRGCKLVVPPCAPPGPPRCNAGVCQ